MRTTNRKQVILGLTAVVAFLVSPHIYGQEAAEAAPAEEVTTPAPEPATQTAEPSAEPATPATEPGAEPTEEVIEPSAQQSAEPAGEKEGFKHHLPIINYTMAMPIGSTYDYLSDYSFRGISF